MTTATGTATDAVGPRGCLETGIERAIGWLIGRQQDDGRWVGTLESNACMEAQWLLAYHVLGARHPRTEMLLEGLLARQRDDGSWDVYYDAPTGDINATVECYVALRAYGYAADDPRLAKARDWIEAHGGVGGVRVFTRYWLALVGLWPWGKTPSLPPEIIWLPSWFPLNIYQFGSWARATIVALCLVRSRRMVAPLPPERRADELFPDGFDYALPRRRGWVERCFLWADRALSIYERLPWQPGRAAARRACVDWVIRHQDADGAWSGIQPPWIYGILGLVGEGYALHHPIVAQALRATDEPPWAVPRDGYLLIQASESPVWDTLLTLLALHDCGHAPAAAPEGPEEAQDEASEEAPEEASEAVARAMTRAVAWVVPRQVRRPGDWQVYVRGVEPGGWAFESANDWYPDTDDTAVAILVLAHLKPRVGDGLRAQIDDALALAVPWLVAMQSSNGGWGAFDKDNTSGLVTRIPFCDFGEALDPPSVDVTAHAIEALAAVGRGSDDPCVRHALDYVLSEQEDDGSWFGRWGVNHIYGTAAVLPALEAIGFDMGSDVVARAAAWIASKQNDDGGWGESCASYMDEAQRGVGPSTASQTGWAVMALVAAGDRAHADAVRRGLAWLCATQHDDGRWDEPYYTGTGFPGYGVGERIDLARRAKDLGQGAELARGFMINYNLYRQYFPLMAMGRARRWLGAD